jgi:hypothetical protein
MAEEKKKKVTEAAEALSAIDSLNAAMVVQGAYLPDKTVIRFDYKFELNDEAAPTYTYIALWVAAKSKWYISGITGGHILREMENVELAKVLASAHTLSATTLTEGESFK